MWGSNAIFLPVTTSNPLSEQAGVSTLNIPSFLHLINDTQRTKRGQVPADTCEI